MNNRVNKKAQLTIFVILALAIVAILILIFINRETIPVIFIQESPINELKNCIKGESNEVNSLKNLISELSSQGGTLFPVNYYLYQDNKIAYLCYTEENYKTCVMQKPLLKQDIEKELKNSIKSRADSCLISFEDSLKKKGYTITYKKPEISVELLPNTLMVSLNNMDLKIKKEKTESYKSIKTDLDSKLYNFVMIASSISNWEARYGNSETMNYMLYYPSLKVEKKPQSDGTRIYILTDRNTQEKFMFASRSLVLPAGLTGT